MDVKYANDLKERPDIFLRASMEVKQFILSHLPDDISKKILDITADFEDGTVGRIICQDVWLIGLVDML